MTFRPTDKAFLPNSRKLLLRFSSLGKWHHHPSTQFLSGKLFILLLPFSRADPIHPISERYLEPTHTSVHLHATISCKPPLCLTMIIQIATEALFAFTVALCLSILLIKETRNIVKISNQIILLVLPISSSN